MRTRRLAIVVGVGALSICAAAAPSQTFQVPRFYVTQGEHPTGAATPVRT